MRKWQICPELTNVCNMRCYLCPHSIEGYVGPAGNKYDRSAGFMDVKLWQKCLSAAQKYGKELSLGFFGEQTLHLDFIEYISMIPRNRRYRVVLNTNWTHITKRDFPYLNRFVDEVRISLDSHDPNTYNTICNPSGMIYDINGDECESPEHVLDIIEEKTRAWVSVPHSRTKLIFTISNINKSQCRGFVKYWRHQLPRRDVVCVKSCISFGGIMQNSFMSRYKCTIPRERRLMVAWNGECSPCNLDVNIALNIGNLNDVEDMREIVCNQKYKTVMRVIRNRWGICRNCTDANNRRYTRNYRGLRG